MYISQIKKLSMLVLFAITLSANAQVTLGDKASQKFDLGFGVEQSAILSTAAAITISGEELQQTSAISLADALYGRLPGLTALQNGGFVGDENRGATLNIRGYQTFSEKEILILVDGYERPIDRLTVEEVESVTVLKDAAAVALLGHEGINGAILVKTKRGANSGINVKASYNHKFTFGQEFAEMVDGYDYARAMNKAFLNDGSEEKYIADPEQVKTGSNSVIYPNVDWRSLAFKDNGSEDRASLSVFGGNNDVKYYTMLNYTDSRGLLKDTKQPLYNSQLKYSKANIRSNVDFNLSPTTKVAVNVLGIFIETSRPNDVDANGATWLAYHTPATAFPVRANSGIWGGNPSYVFRDDNGAPTVGHNLAALIQGSGFQKTHQRQLWADARLTQDLGFWLEGLSASMRAGYDNASVMHESRNMGWQYGYNEISPNGIDTLETVYGNRETKLGFSNWIQSQWRIANAEAGLHYKTKLSGSDNFAASFIYSIKGETRDRHAQTFNRANWMGYFHYDRQNKYVADLVLAANGSNRSYPAKWAFSPTLSLGYIFANDTTGSALLNYGKLRISGGMQHTDCVPAAGIWLPRWNSSNGSFVFGTGATEQWGSTVNSYPNTDFRQERALKFNLGTDIRLWNMIDITADAYYQKRDHILLWALEENSWITGPQMNYNDIGAVNSYGFELSAKYAKKIGNDLFLNVSGMLTWDRNEIVACIESPAYPNLSSIGKRVNEAWGLQSQGFFKDDGDISNSPAQQFSQLRAGDVKYKDVNGDGVVSAFDRSGLGYGLDIPELNYAFTLGAEYKGIGFNALFQGAGKYMKNFRSVDGVWGVLSDNSNSGNRNLSKEYYNNSWDVAGASALYPRLTSQANPNNEQESNVWYKEISFLKLRTCELYYKLPANLVQKLYLDGVKVFVQGQNLLSFDNVAAMDAEVLSTAYPVLKAVNVGLSLTF